MKIINYQYIDATVAETYTSQDGVSLLILLCSFGAVLCMIFAVLGIKFKWFKHRLNFENIPSVRRGSSGTQSGEPILLQGVFHQRQDAESFVEIERPATLPPVRIRKSSRPASIPLPHHQLPEASTFRADDFRSAKAPSLPTSAPPRFVDAVSNNNTSSASTINPVLHAKAVAASGSNRKKQVQNGSNKNLNTTNKNDLSNPKSSKKTQQTVQKPLPVKKEKKEKKERKVLFQSEDEINNAKDDKSSKYCRNDDNNKKVSKNFEKLKYEHISKDDTHNPIAGRRLTGFVRPPKEDMDEILAPVHLFGTSKTQLDEHNGPSSIVLKLDGFNDSDEEAQNIFEKVKSKPKPEPRKNFPTTPETEEKVENDAWSAVSRHRMLTQELAKHHKLKPINTIKEENSENTRAKMEFRNPLAEKPRTMRDMKKSKPADNNESVNLALSDEDTEA